jgi:N-formylglutamate amidohydrolase
MTPTIVLEGPEAPEIPVVYDSPHSGAEYPADFDHVMDRLLLRQAEDAHIDALFAHVVEEGAPLLKALFPRSYIDTNRALDEMDPALVEGEWPHPVTVTDKTGRGMGLVWRQLRGLGPLYARTLTIAEVEARIARCWRPYHDTLASLIDTAHDRFGAVWHVNCHSMPARGDETTVDGPVDRADFVIGDRDGTTCEAAFTELVVETLRAQGFSVKVNDPYKGVELVRRYSDPTRGRHSIQVEVNRRLYMDETTIGRHAGYPACEAALRRLTEAIRSHALARTG